MSDQSLSRASYDVRWKRVLQDLAGNEVWIAAASVAGSMISVRLLPLAALVLLLFWPIRWLATGRLTQRTPADLLLALLLLTIPITLWVTAVPDTTMTQVLRLLTGIGLFYAIVNWARNRKQLNLLVVSSIAAGIGLAIFAIISVDWAEGKLSFFPDWIYSTFPVLVNDTANPNVMAGNIILLLPLAISVPLFAWNGLSRPLRLFSLVSAAAMISILALSQARAGVLALGVVAFLLVTLRWKRGWLVLPAAGLILAVGIRAVGLTEILSFFSARLALGGLAGRLEIWSRALWIIRDFSFTGAGMGSFTETVDALYPLFFLEAGQVDHAHNLFLQVAVDLGIPGLIAWLGIWMTVLYCAGRVYRAGKVQHDNFLTAAGAGLLAGQVALGVHGMVEAVTWGMVRPAPLIWGLWGLAIAAWIVTGRSHSQDTFLDAT